MLCYVSVVACLIIDRCDVGQGLRAATGQTCRMFKLEFTNKHWMEFIPQHDVIFEFQLRELSHRNFDCHGTQRKRWKYFECIACLILELTHVESNNFKSENPDQIFCHLLSLEPFKWHHSQIIPSQREFHIRSPSSYALKTHYSWIV